MTGNSTKLGLKKYEPKVFPDHLMRAPLDTSSSPKRSQASFQSKGKSLKEKSNMK
jgi:hypothetical protein